MTNSNTKTVDLVNPPEQEIGLAEAYADSADENKRISEEFESALGDGLIVESIFEKPIESSERRS